MNKSLWLDNEIEIIKNNYDKLTIRELNKLIPNKTYKQIKSQIIRMGYQFKKVERSRELTKLDNEFILQNYKFLSIDEISKELNVSRYSIKQQFKKLNLQTLTYGQLMTNKLINSFSSQDVEYIKSNVNKLTLKQISTNLERDYSDVFKLCKLNNIEFKSRHQILNDNYEELDKKLLEIGDGKSIKELSTLLNVDYKIIFKRINKLNVNYINDVPKWSNQERQLLLDLYLTTTLDDLCIIMKRSKGSIIENAKKLNIELLKNNYVDNSKISKEQYQYLVENFNKTSLINICNELNINARNVILKVYLSRIYSFKLKGMHSLLEKVIAKILDEYCIEYDSQFKIKTDKSYILCDFKLKHSNKIIEVYGDFWHGKDILHKKHDPRNLQLIRKRNSERENIIKLNNELLIIWENDIINNLQKVYNEINNFVNN